MGSSSGSQGSGSGSGSGSAVPADKPVPHVVYGPNAEQLALGKKIKKQIADEANERARREAVARAEAIEQLGKTAIARGQAIAQMRENVALQAEDFLQKQSQAWSSKTARGPYGSGTNKCNLFVCEVGNAVGAPIPTDFTRGMYPPLAEHWANPTIVIPGWEVVTNPGRGDVAAVPRLRFETAHGVLTQGGHVGIVVGPNQTISHSSIGGDQLVRNRWGFEPTQQGQVVFRRYVGL